MVEFAIVFPVQMFLTLAIIQLSHIFVAKLVVNHAAFSAARAALVVKEGVILGESWQQRAEAEANNAAALVCAPITGVSDNDGSTNLITIPGWDPNNNDEVRRSDISLHKTRVTIEETFDEQGRVRVVANVEHDFELIFLSEVRLMDVWSKYPGGSIGLEDDYTAPHLTLREECFLPRTWDTESP